MEDPRVVPDFPQATFKKRNIKSKPSFRKRVATPTSPPDSDSGFTSSEDEEGRQVRRRRKNVGLTASSNKDVHTKQAQEEAVPSVTPLPLPNNSNDATRASNWYDESADGELNAKNLLGTTRSQASERAESDGSYRGVANYQSFIQKNPNALSKQVGPIKSSTNVRTITVTDFAPDVCKDYKQTGHCGFGDNCKFLHAREDYKQGWELDRDWEIGTKGKKIVGKTVASANRSGQIGDEDKEDDDDLLESIPFACIICKKPYTNPVVTKCGHYFCEACALQRYKKSPSCAACGSGTGGVFNVAKKLNLMLEKKRERAKKRREKAAENGEVLDRKEESDEDA